VVSINMDSQMKSRQPRKRGRPPKPPQKLPTFSLRDLPKVHLPGQSHTGGGKTKLTNRRAAIILYAVASGCYRETAAQLAGIKAETLSHWMSWPGQPYETFQRLVRKAEADLEARMVTALTSKVEIRPELALAILERKFPGRWGKTVPPPPAPVTVDLGTMLNIALERLDARKQNRPLALPLPPNGGSPPHDPRPPRVIDAGSQASQPEPREGDQEQ
jgi:hypothetical protein